MAKKKENKRSWVVTLRCVVTKEIICEDCTEDDARNDPWGQEVSCERELDQEDWKVISVEPNE